MDHQTVKNIFLEFFSHRAHQQLSSAPLVPENDPSALFITAGVQPLVPYILQGRHPQGSRLISVQRCVRTTDMEEVGDKTHATFFEMLGNWSIGDYFKSEAIEWSFELLTASPTGEVGHRGFGLDPDRLYITVFAGDENAPPDQESVECWKKVGVPENRIYFRTTDNWWSPGENGPCGPSTEMFYDLTVAGLGDLDPEEFQQADKDQKVVEVWNDVFMEYEKKAGVLIGKLPQTNVDTGAGLERLLTVLQDRSDIFSTDVFQPLMEVTDSLTSTIQDSRVLADHFRTAVFMLADGVVPSNSDQGYVLRRLLRKAIFRSTEKKIAETEVEKMVAVVSKVYSGEYSHLADKRETVIKEISGEVEKFQRSLEAGWKQLQKLIDREDFEITGKLLFDLYQTYGFPADLTLEVIEGSGQIFSDQHKSELTDAFRSYLDEHQARSRTAATGRFKGGLGGHSEEEVRYHTATHLLNAVLRETLGSEVKQKGSNINPERLRFDFSHDSKLTDELRSQIENRVNELITADLPVEHRELELETAYEQGAIGVFGETYPDRVTVYSIYDLDGRVVSREICGGPHVKRTGELGRFKIIKEESVSAGVRRIKAVLQ